MSIFGFGTPSELTTPIGAMVKTATDSLRISPDWAANVQICDEINRNRRDNADPAIKAIRRRLQDSDSQTVYLSLILLETCMKNCGLEFASRIDRYIMEDMSNIIRNNKSVKNTEEASRLISTWARVFEYRKATHPIFFDTFMGLKLKSFNFPKEDETDIQSYGYYVNPNANR
jgi:hypothetical protein